jgi:hypothetical protein
MRIKLLNAEMSRSLNISYFLDSPDYLIDNTILRSYLNGIYKTAVSSNPVLEFRHLNLLFQLE